MINNWLNDGEKIPSLGGERSKCFILDLEDLIDDECDQIVLSQQLFKAFAASSKNMKNFDKDKMYMFFKHVVYLYNDTLQKSDKYGALTYLNKITKLLDCLSIHSIMELSIEQLNLLLDLNDKDEIISTYKRIEINRHELTQAEFELFEDMLKNTSVGKIRTNATKVNVDIAFTDDGSKVKIPEDKKELKKVMAFLAEELYPGLFTNNTYLSNSTRKVD